MMPPRELSVLTCQNKLCPSQFPAESTRKANHKRTSEGIPTRFHPRRKCSRLRKDGALETAGVEFIAENGGERWRGSPQTALWSATKLSGGSASSGVNRGSKRNRVAQ